MNWQINRWWFFLVTIMVWVGVPVELRGQTTTPSNAYADHFERHQMEINSIWVAPDNTAFLAGRNAIYLSTSDPMRWQAIESLVGSDFWQIVGGTSDHLFLTAHGPINSNTERLLEWTRETGALTQLALIPLNSCRFADGQRGVYIAEPMGRNGQWPEHRWFNFRITTDGGKSWKLHEKILSTGGKDEELRSVQWASSDRLLIHGERSLAMFKVDGEGNVTRQWTTDITKILSREPAGRKAGEPQSCLWLDIPPFLPSSVHLPFIDHSAIDYADDKWPPGESPTGHEIEALSAAQRGLTPRQIVQMSSEVESKRDTFDNYRDQTLWMTKRALEMKSAPATAPAVK